MDIRKAFANRVRDLRHQKGWSQEEFSFESGLARCYIAVIEAGKQNIALSNIEKITTCFKITLKEFFDCKYFK